MSEDFEEEWGFAPDSDYEIRGANKSVEMFGMTREEWEKTLLKAAEMSCDEQVKLLERAKNEKNIEEIERRKLHEDTRD